LEALLVVDPLFRLTAPIARGALDLGAGLAAALPDAQAVALDIARQAGTEARDAIADSLRVDPGQLLQDVQDAGEIVVTGVRRSADRLAAIGLAELDAMRSPLPRQRVEPPPAAPDRAPLSDPARQAQVAAAIAALPPADQAAWQTVEARLRQGQGEVGQVQLEGLAALQNSLLPVQPAAPAPYVPPRLPGAPDSQGRSVLQNLAIMATQPVATGVDPGRLLAEVAQHLDDPARIRQGQFNSCGAGSSQQLFAQSQPAEYVRVIGALAGPQLPPVAITQGGVELTRHPQWQVGLLQPGGRDTASSLFQPAFMQAANLAGALGNYENVSGEGSSPFERSDGLTLPNGYVLPGVFPHQQSQILESLTGVAYTGQLGNGASAFNLAMTAAGLNSSLRIDPWRQATAERPVTVALNYISEAGGMSPHWLTAVGMEDANVVFLNPHGQRETIPEAEVRAHMIGASFPA